PEADRLDPHRLPLQAAQRGEAQASGDQVGTDAKQRVHPEPDRGPAGPHQVAGAELQRHDTQADEDRQAQKDDACDLPPARTGCLHRALRTRTHDVGYSTTCPHLSIFRGSVQAKTPCRFDSVRLSSPAWLAAASPSPSTTSASRSSKSARPSWPTRRTS